MKMIFLLVNLALAAPTGNSDVSIVPEDTNNSTSTNNFMSEAGLSILVVFKYDWHRFPMMLDSNDQLTDLDDQFLFASETGSDGSCSVIHDGNMMIIGGDRSPIKRQISKVDGCRLRRIGSLPMDFELGACTTLINWGRDETMLCFGLSGNKECQFYGDNTIFNAPSAKNNHFFTSLGLFQNKAIAVGDVTGYTVLGNKKVEAFGNRNSTRTWQTLDDFPFVKDYIYGYSMVSFDSALYLFGGTGDGEVLTLAAKYDGSGWTEVGSLMAPRREHRSIVIDGMIMHIGGNERLHFERWTPKGDAFDKEQLDAGLEFYYAYPESFVVSSDFC